MKLQFSRKFIDNVTIALFLALVLFIPKGGGFERIFFAVLLVSTPLLLGIAKRLTFDFITLAGIGILIAHLIFTILRFVFIVDLNLRDFTEFARLLLPVLLLIFRHKFKNLRMQTIFNVFALYVSIDFLVSILAFLGIDFMGLVSLTKSIYVSGAHVDITNRICGLSPGPGQHGTLMIILFIFFYCRVFQSKKIFLPLLFSFLSAVPLFLTQSRTSMIGFAIISLCIPIFYLIFGNLSSKKRSVPILASIIGGGIFLLVQFQDFFSRLLVIMNGLDQVTSYQDRLQGYHILFEKAMEYPAFLVIGYGKDFFHTSVFDSEYLMMFLIYGPIISLIFLSGIFIYLTKFTLKKNKKKYYYGTIVFFLFIAGLLFAYPSIFFLQTSTIPLLFTFLNKAYWEKKKLEGGV